MITVKYLRSIAKSSGIKGYCKMKKSELISVLIRSGVSFDGNEECRTQSDHHIPQNEPAKSEAMNYDEAILALAEIYNPDENFRSFFHVAHCPDKRICEILNACRNDTLRKIYRSIGCKILIDFSPEGMKNEHDREHKIKSLALRIKLTMFAVSTGKLSEEYILKRYNSSKKCKLLHLWLSKKTGRQY